MPARISPTSEMYTLPPWGPELPELGKDPGGSAVGLLIAPPSSDVGVSDPSGGLVAGPTAT